MNPSQYQHHLKKQQKLLKRLLLEIERHGSKYAIFSNLFGRLYEQVELIKVHFENIENQFKIVTIWFSRHPNAMVTIDDNNKVLFDEDEDFIIDFQKGLIISLEDYYLKIKNEYERTKEAVAYLEDEFDKIKAICPDDFKKYEIIEQYEKMQQVLESIANNKKDIRNNRKGK